VAVTRRQQILEALIARMQEIQIANGYATDAGLAVHIGDVPLFGADDPTEVIVIVAQETRPGANRVEILPVEFQAVATVALDQPYLAAEAVLSEITRAMEVEDRTLGGLVKDMTIGPTRLLAREPGSTTVGVGQLYDLTYVRPWGAA